MTLSKKAPPSSRDQLFTSSDIARFCQVDIKTIHNWTEKGEIRGFRTPGRHLRYRRIDVLDFLKKYGYPIPAILQQSAIRIFFVENAAAPEVGMSSALKLNSRCQVRGFISTIAMAIEAGIEAPDAILFSVPLDDVVAYSVITHLLTHVATAHTRLVIYGDKKEQKLAIDAGAHLFVPRGHLNDLKPQLRTLLSLTTP